MSGTNIVKIGEHALNLAGLAAAHWERRGNLQTRTLYVHFQGGQFEQFTGEQANRVWSAIVAAGVDLDSGVEGSRLAGVSA